MIFMPLAWQPGCGYNALPMELSAEYQKTLDYLYSFVDYSLTRSTRYSPELFDLGRMQSFIEFLGRPDRSYPSIHIAGTKGKGSVASFCASALRSAGYRVGLYTSPHLEEYTERIQVDGQAIAPAELVDLVEELRPHLDEVKHLTTFEITTGLAFLYFARQGATAAVVEVGLGGRLDATNVIMPQVSVITSLSYDHTQFLGETLAEIAGEKAGIIKPGVPVISAPQKKEARLVLERVAAERGSPLTQVGEDYLFAPLEHTLKGQSLLVWHKSEQAAIDAHLKAGSKPLADLHRLDMHLLGHHQVENAATAYAALKIAGEKGLSVPEESIRAGFASTRWPARFEILGGDPLVVVDSAHNRDSALKLRLTLDDYFPDRKVTLVFGASEDKDIEGMFSELMPRVQQVIATRSIHPRAMEPELLEGLAHQFGKPAVIAPSIEEALEQAVHSASPGEVVLVTGSIFIAAGARQSWYNQMKGTLE
jgi:dihydrofolate synthase / folylpolyglutamate synthase